MATINIAEEKLLKFINATRKDAHAQLDSIVEMTVVDNWEKLKENGEAIFIYTGYSEDEGITDEFYKLVNLNEFLSEVAV